MDHCTIYNHQLVYDQIIILLDKHLPNVKKEFSESDGFKSIEIKQKGGLFSKSKKLKINYRERITPGYHLNQVTCPLEQNLYGMTEFVSSIPITNHEIHELFQSKIATINSECVFSAESGFTKEAIDILKELSSIGDPFLFVQPSKFFKESKHQHFLDKNFRLLLDTRGETKIDELNVEIESHYTDDQISISESAFSRKEYSESILTSHNVQINKHLPVIEEQVRLRKKETVLERIYALVTLAAKGEGVTPDQLGAVMERLQIVDFSDQEREIMSKDELSEQEKLNATWRYESLYTLLWAIGKVKDLHYPSSICPVEDLVEMILNKTREEFTAEAKLRPLEEILNKLDLIYRMNWACVNARLKEEEPGGSLIPGIVYERHYALNWLICYQDQEWDDISTDT